MVVGSNPIAATNILNVYQTSTKQPQLNYSWTPNTKYQFWESISANIENRSPNFTLLEKTKNAANSKSQIFLIQINYYSIMMTAR